MGLKSIAYVGLSTLGISSSFVSFHSFSISPELKNSLTALRNLDPILFHLALKKLLLYPSGLGDLTK